MLNDVLCFVDSMKYLDFYCLKMKDMIRKFGFRVYFEVFIFYLVKWVRSFFYNYIFKCVQIINIIVREKKIDFEVKLSKDLFWDFSMMLL